MDVSNPFETPLAAQPAREQSPAGGGLWIALALALVAFASQPIITWLFQSGHRDEAMLYFQLRGGAPLLGIAMVFFAGVRNTAIAGLLLFTLAHATLLGAAYYPIQLSLAAIAAGGGLFRAALYVWLVRTVPADRPHHRAFLVALVTVMTYLADAVGGLAHLLPEIAMVASVVVISAAATGVVFLAAPPSDRDEGFDPRIVAYLGAVLIAEAALAFARPALDASQLGAGSVFSFSAMSVIRTLSTAVIVLGSLLYFGLTKESRAKPPSDWLAGGAFATSAGLLILAALGGDVPRAIVASVVFEVSTPVWPIVIVFACGLGRSAHGVLALGLYLIAGSLVYLGSSLGTFDPVLVLSIAAAIVLAAAGAAFAIGRGLRSPHQ